MPRSRNNNQPEPLKKSDWILYLSHIASYNQNYRLGYANLLFLILAIVVAILGFPETLIGFDNNVISSRVILSFMAIFIVVLWWNTSKRINFSKDALTGKTANRLLKNIFSNQYPELKNAKGIQNKWHKIKQKIDNTSDKERKLLLIEKTRKIPDEQRFDNWFNDIPL